MKIKTQSKQSGIGILGLVLVIVGLFIVINGVPLLIWYLRPITGTPLPIPVQHEGFIPLRDAAPGHQEFMEDSDS